MRAAAIGIGSNSLRMLIADLQDGKLYRIERYRAGLRTFAALDSSGKITADMIASTCQKVNEFKNEALARNAEKIHLFATSAVRDAGNQAEFAKTLYDATSLSLEVCSGDTEANLAFWGVAEQGRTGVIDIGGGSTEIVLGEKRDIFDAVSLQMGAVRLYRKQSIASIEEADAVIKTAEEILEPVRKRFVSSEGMSWIGAGGTFTTCAAVVQRIPWQQRENIHGFILTQQNVREALELLAPLSLEERLKLDYLQPQRADIVVHGIAILLACMKNLGISSIAVSECGNLEGYLKYKYLF